MTIEKWLADVYQDSYVGNKIWNKTTDGGSEMVADIRGWGALQYKFKTNEDAKNFQNEVCKFIVEAIREKVARTYGSKGSDDHIVDTNEIIQDKEKIKTAKDNSKIGIRWKEYQDWLNEVPEISDEEIEARVKEVGAMGEYYKMGYRDAIKWYREQLKPKKD